jgi:hypothetical protein
VRVEVALAIDYAQRQLSNNSLVRDMARRDIDLKHKQPHAMSEALAV